jgi:hypothetical protein
LYVLFQEALQLRIDNFRHRSHLLLRIEKLAEILEQTEQVIGIVWV